MSGHLASLNVSRSCDTLLVAIPGTGKLRQLCQADQGAWILRLYLRMVKFGSLKNNCCRDDEFLRENHFFSWKYSTLEARRLMQPTRNFRPWDSQLLLPLHHKANLALTNLARCQRQQTQLATPWAKKWAAPPKSTWDGPNYLHAKTFSSKSFSPVRTWNDRSFL